MSWRSSEFDLAQLITAPKLFPKWTSGPNVMSFLYSILKHSWLWLHISFFDCHFIKCWPAESDCRICFKSMSLWTHVLEVPRFLSHHGCHHSYAPECAGQWNSELETSGWITFGYPKWDRDGLYHWKMMNCQAMVPCAAFCWTHPNLCLCLAIRKWTRWSFVSSVNLISSQIISKFSRCLVFVF